MGEQEANWHAAAVTLYRVSFKDHSGIEHGVEVSADSLHEAAGSGRCLVPEVRAR